MTRKALFPGSFDPLTVGHESIIKRAIPLFDSIIIGIGVNRKKDSFFPVEKRIEWIKKTFAEYKNIEVHSFEGLTVDYCKKIGAQYLIRGLRTSADFEFERAIGQMNKKLDHGIETIFMLTHPEHTYISSGIVREVYANGGDVKPFLPQAFRDEV